MIFWYGIRILCVSHRLFLPRSVLFSLFQTHIIPGIVHFAMRNLIEIRNFQCLVLLHLRVVFILFLGLKKRCVNSIKISAYIVLFVDWRRRMLGIRQSNVILRALFGWLFFLYVRYERKSMSNDSIEFMLHADIFQRFSFTAPLIYSSPVIQNTAHNMLVSLFG